jgi:hypothetical protein
MPGACMRVVVRTYPAHAWHLCRTGGRCRGRLTHSSSPHSALSLSQGPSAVGERGAVDAHTRWRAAHQRASQPADSPARPGNKSERGTVVSSTAAAVVGAYLGELRINVSLPRQRLLEALPHELGKQNPDDFVELALPGCRRWSRSVRINDLQ